MAKTAKKIRMKCPNCETGMTRVEGFELYTLDQQNPRSPVRAVEYPTAHYLCNECEYETVWTKKDGTRVVFDPKNG